MNLIMDNLYLGHKTDAQNIILLKEKGIKHILTVTFQVDCEFPNDFNYKQIKVEDARYKLILPFIPEGVEFIEQALEAKEPILVHCIEGKSRSASMIVAYLIKNHNY